MGMLTLQALDGDLFWGVKFTTLLRLSVLVVLH
jgi:hypothetical protein